MDNDYDDCVALEPKGHVKLKEGINLQSLLTGETFEINFDDINTDEDSYNFNNKQEEIYNMGNVGLGLESDDDDDDRTSTPFEKIAAKMVNVTDDGKIKKLIKKSGIGECPPDSALVSILYASYIEYGDEPIDYVHMKRPYQFRLGTAGLIGLNFAVKSMKVNEKSQFIVHHDYAFGKMGHIPRIPGCATLLLHIELLRFVDSGPALEMSKLSLEDKRQFPIAYKTALSLIENAREHFSRNNIKFSIREYNRAVSLLCECNLTDMAEQEKQQKLLFKLYSNLAICYNKESNPKKACCMCNNIYSMTKNTSLVISAKVYFHNGRALRMLNEYERAWEKLLKAQKLEPHNKDISMELSRVSVKMQEDKKRERELARIFMQNKDVPQQTSTVHEQVDDNFTAVIRSQCEELISSDNEQFKLPGGLTDEERLVAKYEAEKLGLSLCEFRFMNDEKLVYCIIKTDPKNSV